MKDTLGTLLVVLCLGAFACWQIRDSAKKDARLKAQAEKIEQLTRQAGRIDTAIGQWRRDNEKIAGERQDKRENTKKAVRRDPALKEQLDTPLHPALMPGGGLLGRPGPGPDTGGPAGSDPAP